VGNNLSDLSKFQGNFLFFVYTYGFSFKKPLLQFTILSLKCETTIVMGEEAAQLKPPCDDVSEISIGVIVVIVSYSFAHN